MFEHFVIDTISNGNRVHVLRHNYVLDPSQSSFFSRLVARLKSSEQAYLKGLSHAILGNFSIDQVVTELIEIIK